MIAVAILVIVVGAASFATVVNESSTSSERASSQKAEIARKSLEVVEGDLSARNACESRWKTTPASACAVNVPARQDDEGRWYDVTARVRAVDVADDGIGTNATTGDADGNLRDQYRVSVSVRVRNAAENTVGLSPSDINDPYQLDGQVDWGVSRGAGSVIVNVCVLDRPDRSVGAGRCGGAAAPVSGVTVRLTPQRGIALSAASATTGIASFAGIDPETYSLSIAGVPAGMRLHRITPKSITVAGSEQQEASVLLTHDGARVMVCGRRVNPDIGWGWEFTSTNIAYTQVGINIRRGFALTIPYQTYSCRQIVDPLGYRNDLLFRGQYGIEAFQMLNGSNGTGLSLRSWSLDTCGPGSGAPSTLVPATSLPAPGRSMTNSAMALFTLADSSSHTICLDFWSKPILDERCEQLYWNHWHPGYWSGISPNLTWNSGYNHSHAYSPPRYPAECRYFPPRCLDNCPSGETRCIANCDGDGGGTETTGTVRGTYNSQESQFANGPNDTQVACQTPNGSGTGFPGRYHSNAGWGMSLINKSEWNSYDWIGTDSGGNRGRHVTGALNYCLGIGFAFDSQYVDTQPPMDNRDRDGAQRFNLGDCIEVRHAGRRVRGRIWDVGGGINNSIQMSIGGWRGIYGSDARIETHLHGYSIGAHNGGRWPNLNYVHIDGDNNCQSINGEVIDESGDSGPVMQYFAPVMTAPDWRRAVDLACAYCNAPPQVDTNPLVDGRRFL